MVNNVVMEPSYANHDYLKMLQKRKIETEYSSFDDGSLNNIYRKLYNNTTDLQITSSETRDTGTATTFGL